MKLLDKLTKWFFQHNQNRNQHRLEIGCVGLKPRIDCSTGRKPNTLSAHR